MLCFTFLFPEHKSQFNISADSSVGIGRQGAGADSFQNAAFRCGQPRYGTHQSSCLMGSGSLLSGLNRSGLHVSAKQVAIFLVYVTCLYCYCLIIYIFWIKMQLFIWYCFWQSVGAKNSGMHHTNMKMRECTLSPSFQPFFFLSCI